MSYALRQCIRDYPHGEHHWVLRGERIYRCQGVAEDVEIRFYNGEIVVVKK